MDSITLLELRDTKSSPQAISRESGNIVITIDKSEITIYDYTRYFWWRSALESGCGISETYNIQTGIGKYEATTEFGCCEHCGSFTTAIEKHQQDCYKYIPSYQMALITRKGE